MLTSLFQEKCRKTDCQDNNSNLISLRNKCNIKIALHFSSPFLVVNVHISGINLVKLPEKYAVKYELKYEFCAVVFILAFSFLKSHHKKLTHIRTLSEYNIVMLYCDIFYYKPDQKQKT